MPHAAEPDAGDTERDQSVGSLAELYLGNILYAIELAALSLEQQGQSDNAAFYRAIGRKLAEAHGKTKAAT
ncbi:MAG TPA: hypothetical protein VMM17_12065 [Gemmatimonadaceae bacterium]|nr:hypothetical protein [Gemmatimonadaceae bacterium]